jgi:hypothetical protein
MQVELEDRIENRGKGYRRASSRRCGDLDRKRVQLTLDSREVLIAAAHRTARLQDAEDTLKEHSDRVDVDRQNKLRFQHRRYSRHSDN